MANLYSYVPSQVKVSVFGIDLVGLAKDSFISIERIDNLVSFRKAQDGSHTAFELGVEIHYFHSLEIV